MKNIFYKQCVLHKNMPNDSRKVQTTWLPEKYATVGKYLKLNDEDGWQVKHVGDERRSQKYDILHHNLSVQYQHDDQIYHLFLCPWVMSEDRKKMSLPEVVII